MPGLLVYGFGNPGRLDDGLGPALAQAIEDLHLPDVTVDSDYQLMLEDGHLVSQHRAVIFADASVQDRAPFYVERLQARPSLHFSSHSLDPAGVLGVAQDLFHVSVPGWLVAIPGYAFNEFGEGLSPRAQANLTAALEFLVPLLRSGDLGALDRRATPAPVTAPAAPYSLAPTP